MITKVNTDIPNNTNKKIIETLYNAQNWRFGFDQTLTKNPDERDSGFMLFT